MAMIKCPECQKDVSDKAVSCPHCGHPISVQQKTETPVTIELTSKKWKKWQAAGLIVIGIAALVLLNGFANSNWGLVGFGFFLLFVAFVVGIIFRIGSWWSNG